MASPSTKHPEYFAEVMPTDAPKLNLTFRIETCSLLYHTGSKKHFSSNEFYVGGYSWRFYICPKRTPKDSVSFALALEGPKDHSPLPDGFQVDAKFYVYIYNHIKDNYTKIAGNQGSMVRFEGKKLRTWADPSLPITHLTSPVNEYLFCDECMFGVEVLICDNECRHDRLSIMNGEATGSCTFELKPFSIKISELQKITVGMLGNFKVGEYNCSIMYSLYNRDGILGDGPVQLVTLPFVGKSNSTKTDRFLSLHIIFKADQLEDVEGKWCKRLNAKVMLRLKDQSLCGEHVQVEACQWFGLQPLCWPRFIELAAITNPNKGFLVNDALRIEAEVSVLSSLTRTYIDE